MFSQIRNSTILVLGVAALTLFSSKALAQAPDGGAQRLDNYQGGSGQQKQCGHKGRPAAQEARLRALRRQQQTVATAQLNVLPKAAPKDSPSSAENPEEVAARQLNLARELTAEAALAQQGNDRARALKLNERVEDRLTQLIDKYSATEASNQAIVLLKQARAQ
jgi:hypothetical protein